LKEAIRGVLQDMMNGLPRLRAEIGTTRHADDAEQVHDAHRASTAAAIVVD
jgi:hypothetical protein